MYTSMLHSANPLISFIAKRAQTDRTTIIGSNIEFVCKNHNLFNLNCEEFHSCFSSNRVTVDTEQYMFGCIIRELVMCREQINHLPGFTETEIQSIIDDLSVM